MIIDSVGTCSSMSNAEFLRALGVQCWQHSSGSSPRQHAAHVSLTPHLLPSILQQPYASAVVMSYLASN